MASLFSCSSQILLNHHKTLQKWTKHTPTAILIQGSANYFWRLPPNMIYKNLYPLSCPSVEHKTGHSEIVERSQAQLPIIHQGHNNILCPIDATSPTTRMSIHLFSFLPREACLLIISNLWKVSNMNKEYRIYIFSRTMDVKQGSRLLGYHNIKYFLTKTALAVDRRLNT